VDRRILFVWTGLTSYMADCWRRLAAEPGVALKVWIDMSGASAKAVDFNAADVMRGIDFSIVKDGERRAKFDELAAWKPDVVYSVGWRSGLCRAVAEDVRLKGVPKVCCFDMPWRWKLRCLAAPLVLRRFLKNFWAAFVPGEVCARYADWLGFPKTYRGLFAIDTERFGRAEDVESGEAYFLYIGRDSSEKRLDDIRRAHAAYRAKGGRLALRMYGKGLEGGFAKPEDVPGLMHRAAAVVLASDFDPWPLVLLEAMSAGCPVIASDKCTNRPELGKNWRVFRVGDGVRLAQLMGECENAPSDAAARAEDLELARRYDCGEWVKRVKKIVEEVTK